MRAFAFMAALVGFTAADPTKPPSPLDDNEDGTDNCMNLDAYFL